VDADHPACASYQYLLAHQMVCSYSADFLKSIEAITVTGNNHEPYFIHVRSDQTRAAWFLSVFDRRYLIASTFTIDKGPTSARTICRTSASSPETAIASHNFSTGG
jgi:hypothetical protein